MEKIIELEKEQQMANILIDSLDEESKFIVIQKHFEKKKWNIITHQFNSKYRRITSRRIYFGSNI